ncbi:MAG: hypothetical protein NVSMB9_05480 [Isosphaeraceae bacterium]
MGSDSSDRFQGVRRWREELTPQGSARTDQGDQAALVEGWNSYRFVAPGWPTTGDEVRLIDRRWQAASGWTVGLAVLTLGLALRRLKFRVRTAVTTALVGLGFLSTALATPELAGPSTGLSGGSLALAFLWLGESLPGLQSIRRRLSLSRLGRRSRRTGGAGLVAPSLLAAILLIWTASVSFPQALLSGSSRSRTRGNGPIVALFPYEGAPDLAKPPDRAILRLEDHEFLRSLAEPALERSTPTLEAIDVLHRTRWSSPKAVTVESEMTLVASGQGLARWTFPAQHSQDITATLDGIQTPVKVEPGGRLASIQIEVDRASRKRRGLFQVKLNRSINLRRGQGRESIELPVTPHPAARFAVEGHPLGFRVDVPSARGTIDGTGGAGGVEGLLGPADHLDVRWTSSGTAAGSWPTPSVEALYLWDATPAGDRVRALLTYHDPEGTELVRFGLGRGVLVRASTIPGTVDTSYEGSPDAREWVARITPPLPDGAQIALDLWRPGDTQGKDLSASTTRQPPRIELLGVNRFSALLALRRPSDWLGRIETSDTKEQVGEEEFVRAWGNLPDDPMTLSGVVRLPSPPSVADRPTVETGPRPPRLRVQQTARLTVSPGRLDLTLDADLTETSGSVHEVDLTWPAALQISSLSATGLTDWSRSTPSGLHLRFDGPSRRLRHVRVHAWLPIVDDPIPSRPEFREVQVPWPRWPRHEVLPGTLTVSAPTRVQVSRSSGAVVAPDGPPKPKTEPAANSLWTYRLDQPDDPLKLRWEFVPPRVAVRVRSQITINPDSSNWVAELRYEVAGGSLDAINLSLPSEWARSASIWLPGSSHRRVTDTKGKTTYWSIQPDRPVWGLQRIVVQSSVPLVPGESLIFPELKPLGRWGAVDTNLRVVNATRDPISVEGSSGLQPMTPEALTSDDELALSTLRNATTTGYHVIKDQWSLKVRRAAKSALETSSSHTAQVKNAAVACTLAADGSVLGRGLYQVSPHSSPFLPLRLEPGARPLWAAVNGNAERPLAAGPELWLIPVAEGKSNTVELVWRSEAGNSRPSLPRPLPLPRVGSGRVPTVVSVHAPDTLDVKSLDGHLVASSPEWIELAKARWLARTTAESLQALDQGSRIEEEDLVASLVRFELLLRQAERAAGWSPSAFPDRTASRLAQVRHASHILRTRLREGVSNAAFRDMETSARAHIGLTTKMSSSTVSPSVERPPAVLVRSLGSLHAFQGNLSPGGPTPLVVTFHASPGGWIAAYGRLLLGIGVLGAILLAWGFAPRAARSSWTGPLTLTVLAIHVAFWSGPIGFMFAGVLAFAGRITRA